MRIQDLTAEELKALIEKIVEEKIKEFLGDPDWGLELREEVKERLKRSLKAVERGERGVPLEEVIKRLNLK